MKKPLTSANERAWEVWRALRVPTTYSAKYSVSIIRRGIKQECAALVAENAKLKAALQLLTR
jgi:hypothetical protein